jgi:hypothetical protein
MATPGTEHLQVQPRGWIARSRGIQILFFCSTLTGVCILLGSNYLGTHTQHYGLTPIFYVLFTELDSVACICSLLILVAAVLLPEPGSTRTVLRWLGERPAAIALASGLFLSAGALLVYQNHPLAMDEYTQLFQSRVFAAGHLAGSFPPALLDWLIPEGFQNYFLFVSKQTGAVASAYWPSFALLLTPFTALGIPWACNPTISALTVLAIHRLALRLFDDSEAAGMAVLLTVASPEFFANGISYYSMPAHLLANTAFAVLLTRPAPGRAFAAGVLGSVALTLHSPLPHLLFALPWLAWLALQPGRFRLLGSVAAGYAPLCIVLGLGWFWFTTDLRQAGMDAALAASTHAAQTARLGQAFVLPDTNVLVARLIGLAKIWVWAVPGLLILATIGAWRGWANIFTRLLVLSAMGTFTGFLFVSVDQGHGWGFRYFHPAWAALPLLAAGALRKEPAEAQTANLFASDDARSFVVGCALLTLVFGVGLRAWQIRDFIAHNLKQVPAYTGLERRVVIIDPSLSFYAGDLVQNDPWLRGDVIRMITRGSAEDAAMMRAHFPTLHRVYADRHGTVWSAASEVPAWK